MVNKRQTAQTPRYTRQTVCCLSLTIFNIHKWIIKICSIQIEYFIFWLQTQYKAHKKSLHPKSFNLLFWLFFLNKFIFDLFLIYFWLLLIVWFIYFFNRLLFSYFVIVFLMLPVYIPHLFFKIFHCMVGYCHVSCGYFYFLLYFFYV